MGNKQQRILFLFVFFMKNQILIWLSGFGTCYFYFYTDIYECHENKELLKAEYENIYNEIYSGCHREIQRRDQRLRSIQKTIFGVLCLLIGIAAYYFTFYHTETGPLIKNHQPGQDSEAEVSTELCPSSSD